MLTSFGAGLNVAVLGASGGIGAALAAHMTAAPNVARTFALCRTPEAAQDQLFVDIEDESSIAAAAESLESQVDGLHAVIVATGILHDAEGLRPEKSWRDLEPGNLERAFRVNAAGPALVAKHLLPLLARDRKSAFAAVSARVGSISDNELGGWYAYRASKAALNMMVRNLSIELARKNPGALCVGLHPGTVDTRLSAPFQRGVPAGNLFTPAHSAACLLEVLDRLTLAETGGVFDWDGTPVPA
ncbi:MAG: hypothetical protein CL566_04300 [Alphaproteobacteria bacterium]|nr:hypothetical protein [Alphaproteobacteria bacterium]